MAWILPGLCSMKGWGAFTTGCLIATASYACAENDGATPRLNDGIAGLGDGGGSGGASGSASDLGVGGDGAFERCAEPSPSPNGAADLLANDLEFDFPDHTTREGHVSTVAADHLEVSTPEASYTFRWRGPALTEVFDVGDAVQIAASHTRDGLFPAQISTVRSSRTTAVVVAGAPWMIMSMEAGSTTVLRGLAPELPELVYALASCCNTRSSDGDLTTRCDYSALEANYDGAGTAVPRGGIGELGPWSVTNVRSTYVVNVEHQWDIQVTLLGPGTQEGLDAGL